MSTARLDPVTVDALERFKKRLVQRYGDRFDSIVLFGSRARGDATADSDADVAVLLQHLTEPIREQMAMGDDAYDVWMETGVRIEPWVFTASAMQQPRNQRGERLLEVIRREGIPA